MLGVWRYVLPCLPCRGSLRCPAVAPCIALPCPARHLIRAWVLPHSPAQADFTNALVDKTQQLKCEWQCPGKAHARCPLAACSLYSYGAMLSWALARMEKVLNCSVLPGDWCCSVPLH